MVELVSLNDDTVIYILSFLGPAQLISVRKTCKRMYALTALRSVWINAYLHNIIGNGYPFPNLSLNSFSVWELERYVCHSARLAKGWLSGSWIPQRLWSTSATANTSVTDVRLVPGSQGTLLFTLSKIVWSAITLWKLEPVISQAPGGDCTFNKCCEWSPRGAIFSGFALNSDPLSEVKLAISVLNNGNHTVELLSLKLQESSNTWCLQPIFSIPSTFRPVALEGDLLAIDDVRETIVFNWRTRAYATLKCAQDDRSILQHDNCIQVVFTPQSVLVIRAHSVHLFPFPTLNACEDQPPHYFPIAQHSFGWIDGASVQLTGRHGKLSDEPPSLSVLVRAETDDPWASDSLSVKLYTLQSNPFYTPDDRCKGIEKANAIGQWIPMTSSTPPKPYIFPPVLTSRVTSRRGVLRCTSIILGKSGTALWLQPQDQSAFGLHWTDTDDMVGPRSVVQPDKYESLVASVFPGALFSGKSYRSESDVSQDNILDMEGKVIHWNEGRSWSSLDYDEDVGRIVLSTGFGNITILDL